MSDILENVQVDTLSDLIDLLAPPPEPLAVPMLPQTVGWVVLAGLFALGFAWYGWRRWQRWRADAYRREALVELEGAGDDPAIIAAILRRTALAAWPRKEVASLYGRDWLHFLNRTSGVDFISAPGSSLADAPYTARGVPVPGLGDLAARWVRSHRLRELR